MSTSRETICAALLATLAAASGVTVASRRFVPFDEVGTSDFPYLILMQDRETVDASMRQAGGSPAVHKLEFKALIYAMGDGTEQAIPATALNAMVDGIEAALTPVGMLRQQNLGIPAIQWAVISGPIEYDGSAFGNVGIAVIPLEVLFT